MGTMEKMIRRIVREEIARALLAGVNQTEEMTSPWYELGYVERNAMRNVGRVFGMTADAVLAGGCPTLPGAVEHTSTNTCTACEHGPHEADLCSGMSALVNGQFAPCECTSTSTGTCSVCRCREHPGAVCTWCAVCHCRPEHPGTVCTWCGCKDGAA